MEVRSTSPSSGSQNLGVNLQTYRNLLGKYSGSAGTTAASGANKKDDSVVQLNSKGLLYVAKRRAGLSRLVTYIRIRFLETVRRDHDWRSRLGWHDQQQAENAISAFQELLGRKEDRTVGSGGTVHSSLEGHLTIKGLRTALEGLSPNFRNSFSSRRKPNESRPTATIPGESSKLAVIENSRLKFLRSLSSSQKPNESRPTATIPGESSKPTVIESKSQYLLPKGIGQDSEDQQEILASLAELGIKVGSPSEDVAWGHFKKVYNMCVKQIDATELTETDKKQALADFTPIFKEMLTNHYSARDLAQEIKNVGGQLDEFVCSVDTMDVRMITTLVKLSMDLNLWCSNPILNELFEGLAPEIKERFLICVGQENFTSMPHRLGAERWKKFVEKIKSEEIRRPLAAYAKTMNNVAYNVSDSVIGFLGHRDPGKKYRDHEGKPTKLAKALSPKGLCPIFKALSIVGVDTEWEGQDLATIFGKEYDDQMDEYTSKFIMDRNTEIASAVLFKPLP